MKFHVESMNTTINFKSEILDFFFFSLVVSF